VSENLKSRNLLRRRLSGFTLIELLVVIVILALLMAIAIPAYLAQQKKAKDSAAKQYLATSLRSARGELVSNGGSSGYPNALTLSALLSADQPQLTFKTGTSGSATSPKTIVIDPSSQGKTLILYGYSESGDVWQLNATPTSSSDNSNFTRLPGGAPYAVSLAAAASHTCAIMSDTTVKCWGNESFGQLGDGVSAGHTTTAVSVTGLTGATGLALGLNFSCALLSSGSVKCWGDNSWGNIGNGVTGGSYSTPVSVSGISTATQIAAGNNRQAICALLAAGTIKCWGYGAEGELGNGGTSPSNVPVAVSSLTGVTGLTSGGLIFCGNVSGSLSCWGYNAFGAVGNGTSGGNQTTPSATVGLAGTILTASGGEDYDCAIISGGSVKCVGLDDKGQLGDGGGGGGTTWRTPTGLSGVSQISSFLWHTCALVAGSVKCWGWNRFGENGDGAFNVYDLTPVSVTGISTATAITAGQNHACAVLADHSVKCWGYNGNWQIGDGTNTDRLTPVTVNGI
jgi:prepilin-type N-terminal cleavage/methylation domain-containing protein